MIYEKMNRNSILDYMKIIGIIMVVMNHLCVNVYGFGISLIFLTHMPIFYCVSGFLLYTEVRKKNLKEFFGGKVKRLLVPYVIWSFISLCFNTLKLEMGGESLDKVLIEIYQIFVEGRSVWFLLQLFFSLVFSKLFYDIAVKLGFSEYFVFAVQYVVVLLFFPTYFLAFFKYKSLYPFMFLGYIVASYLHKNEHKVTQIKKNFLKMGWISIPLYFALDENWYSFLGEATDPFVVNQVYKNISLEWFINFIKYDTMGVVGVVSVLWICVMLSLKKTFVEEKLIYMAKYTLDIYVMHKFVIYGLMIFLKPVDSIRINIIIAFTFSVIIIYIISMLSEKILRRIKFYSISVGQVHTK